MNPINPEPKDTAFLAIQSLLENMAPCCDKEVKVVDLKEAKQLMEHGKFDEAIQQLKMEYMEVCQRNDLEDKFIEMDEKVNAEIALVEVLLCQAKQLMKHRKSKEAEELLDNACQESFNTSWRSTMSDFTLDMAVVEVLICQGKYAEAKKRRYFSSRWVWEKMPDARIPLYKAIIHTMLEENDEAKKNWDEFLTATADKEENSEEAYKKLIRKGWENRRWLW